MFGYAQQEGKQFKTSVSVQTIYHYIKKGLFLNLTQEELPGTGNTSRHIRKSARKKLLAPRRGRASNSGPRK